jgi:hypothetical protein
VAKFLEQQINSNHPKGEIESWKAEMMTQMMKKKEAEEEDGQRKINEII